MPAKKNPPTPRGRNCFNCGSPAHLRQMCPAVDGKLVKLQDDPVLTAPTSTTVGVAGKSAITPTRACYGCHSNKHLIRDCKRSTASLTHVSPIMAGKSAVSPTRACYGCNSKEHLIRDCPRSTASLTPVSTAVAGKSAISPTRACYRCLSTDHLVRTCPVPVPERGQGPHDVPVSAAGSDQHPVLSVWEITVFRALIVASEKWWKNRDIAVKAFMDNIRSKNIDKDRD